MQSLKMKIFFVSIYLLFFTSCTLNYYGAESRKIYKKIGCTSLTILQKSTPDFVVRNYEELILAIDNSLPYQTIYIKDTSIIDLTGKPPIQLKRGVCLVSGNSCKNRGALLFTKDLGHSPAIQCKGDDIKIVGIRLMGPDTSRRIQQMYELIAKNQYYSLPYSHGIRCIGYGKLLVQNCELLGWSYAAIDMESGSGNIIRNNYIHHNQRLGLGYGVALHDAYAIIEENFFNWNRHSVAGSGRLNSGYEIRNNIFGKRSLNYVVDMHGIYDERVKDTIGGTDLHIHHNTFYTTEDGPIVIHGDPINTVKIHHNIFLGHISWDKVFTKGIYFRNGKVKSYKNMFKSDIGEMKFGTALLKSQTGQNILRNIKILKPKFSIE